MGNCQTCLNNEPEQIEIVANNPTVEDMSLMQEQSPLLVLDVRTWQKESYSLYDYENSQFIHCQQISVNGNSYLTCKANKVLYNEGSYSNNNENNDEALLLPLEFDNERFQLLNLRFPRRIQSKELIDEYQKEDGDKLLSENQTVHADFQMSFNIQKLRTNTNRQMEGDLKKGSKIWLVTRSIQNNSSNEGIILKVGDRIKLGRVKLVIKAIQLQNNELQNTPDDISMSSVEDKNEDTKQCRVCLSTGETFTNPLIDPCKCCGGTKYIHIKCLLKWYSIHSHFNSNAYCTRLIWKSLECEICKYQFPPVFEREGRTYNLVELSKPKQPYVMMEFHQKKQHDNASNNDRNGVYIINFGTKKELRIGRNHEVEISIADISVSREHAQLRLVDDKIVLSDKKSKFGTLVLLQKNITLSPQLSGLEIQIKRTLIKINNNQNTHSNQQLADFEQLLGRID
ncbi:unnamed protein product (macronuclear) [Paramecium tetraurelia]|uniref:FHA domain-containing protein n=1 Tax=Paramecium tetraurelia TaxID=5888 RepID=A0BEP2_PARTE|nr:uncharacterized protein GSPATT00028042001 [Paramecium tetraurelia]CAK57009.1 unnamed protein product [Paramecium tetraurelia]|eukprot:XP_001424407.1 hypothetical protein (macronuclear) [Paramecium tetraurelia strain d4-2]